MIYNRNGSMKADIYFSGQQDFASVEEENHLSATASKSIPLTEGMSLYHALQTEEIALSAPCAGNGTCGACKIKLLKGELSVTDKEKYLQYAPQVLEMAVRYRNNFSCYHSIEKIQKNGRI